jgi:DNA helicase-2/ATP-dependent DNA helicase PcrA
MFKDYSVLSEIISSKYPYILVDEYQDTEEETIKVLLDHILKAKNKCVVGFFGDSMQKIYDKGIGKMDQRYYEEGSKEKCLNYITKEENYRCSKTVIALLNKIRKNIKQVEGPKNKEGSITFFTGKDLDNDLVILETKYGWDFKSSNTKILFLTHTSIGRKLGYDNLLPILTTRYGQFGRDRFFNKDDIFGKFLIGENGVEKLIENYELGNYGEIIDQLKRVGFSLVSHSSKEILKQRIDELNRIRCNGKVGDVFDFIRTHNLINISDKILEFETYIKQDEFPDDEKDKAEAKKQYYNSLMDLKYSEIIAAYKFVEEKTIYSTKHGTKGAEYENVLVVLDGAWSQMYNFNEVLNNNSPTPRIERSLNLLYVSCSRAKNNLAILSVTDMSKYKNAMSTVVDWFGADRVFNI